MKKQRVRANVVIEKANKGGMFNGHLEDNPSHHVILTVTGRMQRGKIKMVKGDIVDVELSPYDLTRGRITWRYSGLQKRGGR